MNLLCRIGIHSWPAWSDVYLEKTNIINEKTGKLFYIQKIAMQKRTCRWCHLLQKREV